MATALTQADHMTQEQRSAYAVRLRAFSQRMRNEGDLVSADFNEWMASQYDKTVEELEANRSTVHQALHNDVDGSKNS